MGSISPSFVSHLYVLVDYIVLRQMGSISPSFVSHLYVLVDYIVLRQMSSISSPLYLIYMY